MYNVHFDLTPELVEIQLQSLTQVCMKEARCYNHVGGTEPFFPLLCGGKENLGDLRLKTDTLIFVGADAVILPFTSLKKMLIGKVKGTLFATTFSHTNWRISQLEPGDNVWSIPNLF